MMISNCSESEESELQSVYFTESDPVNEQNLELALEFSFSPPHTTIISLFGSGFPAPLLIY